MHIKHMHEMIENLAEYGKCMIETGVRGGAEEVNLYAAGQVVDMIKDLADAEYHARIAKEMQKCEEEEEEAEKFFFKMLKDEYKDEYKRMREEYGEGEETDRRFYDRYRYKNGRFAPKGRGTRRGYVEPPYYHMYEDYNAEEMRDLDRHKGRLYFTPMNMDGKKGSDGGNYADGYSDGQTRGYSDGYEKGMSDGRKSGGTQSRYDRAKRGYEEAKEQHKGGTTEDKQITMREAEKFVNVATDEIMEMLEDASPEVKNMVKTKVMSKMQKLQ